MTVHIVPQGTELGLRISGPSELMLLTFDHDTLQAIAPDVSAIGDIRQQDTISDPARQSRPA